MAGAIRYGLTRLKRLRPYLDDGRLSIDNNAAERGMLGSPIFLAVSLINKINRIDELLPWRYDQTC